MGKVVFDVTKESVNEVLGTANPEGIEKLRKQLTQIDTSIEDFILTLFTAIK